MTTQNPLIQDWHVTVTYWPVADPEDIDTISLEIPYCDRVTPDEAKTKAYAIEVCGIDGGQWASRASDPELRPAKLVEWEDVTEWACWSELNEVIADGSCVEYGGALIAVHNSTTGRWPALLVVRDKTLYKAKTLSEHCHAIDNDVWALWQARQFIDRTFIQAPGQLDLITV